MQKTVYPNEFKKFHPIVNFFYFLFTIGFSVFFLNPICSFISLFCGFLYTFFLKGKKEMLYRLAFLLPVMTVTVFVNPLFNHEGATILRYFPNGNPLTLESIIYGACASLMFGCVICWFWCFNEVMTSDKFIYLFGKITPSLSLILSMALRFVPHFSEQTKKVINAQKCIGNDIHNGNIFEKTKKGLKILSIMITQALENAIDTADSMKARGYGLTKRTFFSIYRFEKRDKITLFSILFFGIYIIFGKMCGQMKFVCYPLVKISSFSVFELSLFVSYFVLSALPVIIEISEVKKWNALKSKI